MRKCNYSGTIALLANKLLDLESGDTTAQCYGLAFDIGATTVAGTLMDLKTGSNLKSIAALNKQQIYGADIISRIDFAAKQGVKVLQSKVAETVNDIIEDILAETSIKREHVYLATVVGNSTMTHMMLGIDPTSLIQKPYVQVCNRSLTVAASDIGINLAAETAIHFLPGIKGYIGSDTVGAILATEIDKNSDISLLIDIGTNGEIVIGRNKKILCCSTAANPAFEGVKIKHGMRAAQGAIEEVVISEDCIVKVIGNVAPVGICGSGLIDCVAQLIKAGIISNNGRIRNPALLQGKVLDKVLRRLKPGSNGLEFELVSAADSANGEAITVTQQDVRELQLAKGAILAGIRILLQEMDLNIKSVKTVYLAGAFGSHVKIDSIKMIKLIPEFPEAVYANAGNAAGIGAQKALLNQVARAEANSIARQVDYLDLSSHPLFLKIFADSMNF